MLVFAIVVLLGTESAEYPVLVQPAEDSVYGHPERYDLALFILSVVGHSGPLLVVGYPGAFVEESKRFTGSAHGIPVFVGYEAVTYSVVGQTPSADS